MSGRRSKNCLEGNAEGGLREIAHEFGGWIPHGGDNRDSDGIGMGLVVSIVLFFFRGSLFS